MYLISIYIFLSINPSLSLHPAVLRPSSHLSLPLSRSPLYLTLHPLVSRPHVAQPFISASYASLFLTGWARSLLANNSTDFPISINDAWLLPPKWPLKEGVGGGETHSRDLYEFSAACKRGRGLCGQAKRRVKYIVGNEARLAPCVSVGA